MYWEILFFRWQTSWNTFFEGVPTHLSGGIFSPIPLELQSVFPGIPAIGLLDGAKET